MSCRWLVCFGLGLVTTLAAVLPARAQDVTWAGSADLTTGDYYFTETATDLWISNALTVRIGLLRFDASLPFRFANSDVVTRVGGIPVPTGGSRHSGDVAGRGGSAGSGGSGEPTGAGATSSPMRDSIDPITIEEPGSLTVQVADPMFGAGFDVPTSSGILTSVRFGVSAKVPARSAESGVGTGEWDVGVGGGVSLAVSRWYVLLDATWWTLGDLPDLELDDALAYGAAVGGAFGNGSLGWALSLWGATRMIDGVDAPTSIGGDLYFNFVSGRSLRLGVRLGLTESAPELGGSVGWSIPLTT
jgi:hypothetical protein